MLESSQNVPPTPAITPGPARPLTFRERLDTQAFWLQVLGVVLIVWWGWYWIGCFDKQRLRRFPPLSYYGFETFHVDFLHNYLAVYSWTHGHNPYSEIFGDPLGRKLCYPPIVLVCFSWCALFTPKTASMIWGCTLCVYAFAGSWAAWWARKSLGLTPVTASIGIAWIVLSIPVGYAIERGNYDLAIIPLLLIGAYCLREKGLFRDMSIGAAFALATCLKVYPGLLILGLLPLRRYRAFVFSGLFGMLMGSFQAQNLPIAAQNLKELAAFHESQFKTRTEVFQATHTISMNWNILWHDTIFDYLRLIPGNLGAFLCLAPFIGLISWRMYNCRNVKPLLIPYLLWLAAAATYAPKVANDYNLFFLPMAALAVWDRRDPVWVHSVLGFMILWLQPIPWAMSAGLLLVAKVFALYAVGASLEKRILELSGENRNTPAIDEATRDLPQI